MQASHYLPRPLPEALQGLAVLALDLRWSWHHGADELWRAADPELWDATQNPWLILDSISEERLDALAADAPFRARLEAEIEARDRHYSGETWFGDARTTGLGGPVAYFSMEFGVSEALPIYSGGLGVLAGDYLKTACDLGVPVIGIGLLYQEGYFRQALDANGEQLEFYPYSDPTQLPVVPLRDADGEWVHVALELPGRRVWLRAWEAQVGRRSLYLLDSNDLLNDPGDRGITSELYGGGSELRLQQEIALGIGGWRLLPMLGIECCVCHLNEGHAAFAVLERARARMKAAGCSFAEALRATRAGTLFTTHTPVEAGFDRFAPELFAQYFRGYAEELGLDVEALLALGRGEPRRAVAGAGAGDAEEPFNMAYLAVRGSGAVNGVSRLHGEVSRRIFAPLFPRWPEPEVPVGHVTNGVHVPTWDSAAADTLWTGACGPERWRGTLENLGTALRGVDDETLWRFRCDSRRALVAALGGRLARQGRRRGAGPEEAASIGRLLDPNVLTIGFARRFAEYKRTNLLLADPDRLVRLLNARDRPVQLVIAGKAHPQDKAGRRLIREWQDFLRRPEVRGRAVFVEDYDLSVAAALTRGVDVWLNTPRRPWEASGTSGMKVLVNGGLNFSELDGWWAEAYAAEVGWALGDGREHAADAAGWDAAEARALYGVLEAEVVPCFYRREASGLPVEWIARMRESMAALTPRFSTNRMLREYVEQYYVPLAAASVRRDAAAAAALEAWRGRLEANWASVRFGGLSVAPAGADHRFEVQVYLHELDPGDVAVEVYADALDDAGPERHPLERDGELRGAHNSYTYFGLVPAKRPASDYTPRIIPAHALAAVPLEAGYIAWYR